MDRNLDPLQQLLHFNNIVFRLQIKSKLGNGSILLFTLFFMKSILVVYNLTRPFLGCRRNPHAYASVKSGLKFEALYKNSAHISNSPGWDCCRFVGCVCVMREFLIERKFDLAFNSTHYFVIWWKTKSGFFSPEETKIPNTESFYCTNKTFSALANKGGRS